MPLELLAPARNVEFGIAAIDHGADAVYIGGPAFGARAAAGNAIADIERLARHAHRFSARVYVALNTILTDDELEPARRMAWEAFEAGADALIVQDMGLLELDLPPIALHASTQTDNRTPEKVSFLERVGFSQIVLARELSLEQIRQISGQTTAALEFFVHGALCVSYSGRCGISHALTGRSANRGECAQLCRLPYTLRDEQEHLLADRQHLLSLKDNDQSANLLALAEAGISSFKIEGRLKDLSYVKNVTAYYRKSLDNLFEQSDRYRPASSGRCTFTFVPQPEKTFNRGATDYFLNGRRRDIAEFRTPKFFGEAVGRVSNLGRDSFEVESDAVFNNGDGLCYFEPGGTLCGMRINRAEGRRLFPAEMPAALHVGTLLYRNHDQSFERGLEKRSAERKIPIRILLQETEDGYLLNLSDTEGNRIMTALPCVPQAAKNGEGWEDALRGSLGKLGNTAFSAETIVLDLKAPRFIPTSAINALRREAVEVLETARLAAYRRPPRREPVIPPPRYPSEALDCFDNVFNSKAEKFYRRHGVTEIAAAYESNTETGPVPLMTTKHCLRYSLDLCPRERKGIRPRPLFLEHGDHVLTVRFDCKRCEMQVVGALKTP